MDHMYCICVITEGFHWNSGLILWQRLQFTRGLAVPHGFLVLIALMNLHRFLMIWLYLVLQSMELAFNTVVHFREPIVSTVAAFPTLYPETVNLL